MSAKTRIIPALLLAAMLLPTSVRADTFGPYTYSVSGDKATITDFDTTYPGVLSIASTLGGYTVNSIGNDAFRHCSKLTSVTIPSSVTSIGNYAFYSCSALTSVTIPDSVTSIGDYAFYSCSALASVTIPSSVTSISQSAFGYCTALISVTIPSSVTSIGRSAFNYCKSLTSVTIPSSVTSIGQSAFWGCSSLTSVTIPSSVTSIGDNAFYSCSDLTSVNVDPANSNYASIGGILFDKGLTSLIQCPGGKTGSYSIPASVTSIGYAAFRDCTSLTSVAIPDSVTSIADATFYNCTALTSVTIPSSVTSIGSSAFMYCSDLTNITVSISNPAYASTNGVLFNKGFTTLILCPGRKTGSYTIPSSVTSIDNYAFAYCTALTSVNIPSSVTSIDSYDFYCCSSLTSVTIPPSVTSIGLLAFYSCTNLASVTIPPSVTSIGQSAFGNCKSLASVTIPSSVTAIDSSAFANCTDLTSVNVDPANSNYASIGGILFNKNLTTLIRGPGGCSGSYTIPGSVTSIGGYAFSGCSSLTSVTIPDSVTSIGSQAFSSCSSLTSVTIPPSVTSIGSLAFSSCSKLTSVTIPSSVTSIGFFAFQSCTSLTSVTIPSSVTSIGGYAFSGCSSLASVTIPDSVTSIGDNAFSSCTNLTSVTIPSSVTSIGGYAFFRCSSLTSVLFTGTPPTIGTYAFDSAPATIYYLPAFAASWPSAFAGRPTKLWGHQITATSSPGGSVVPAGTITVAIGASTNITILPNTNYHVADVLVNGVSVGPVSVYSFTSVTSNQSIHALFAIDEFTLTVATEHGGACPGSLTAGYGSELSLAITNSPVISGWTQYFCTGATASAHSFTQVTPTNVLLTITNNDTLTWQWQTQYRLAAGTNGNGSVTAAGGWYAAGSNAVLTANAGAYWQFAGWDGDTNGCIVAGNVITAAMTQARTLIANFSALTVCNVTFDPQGGTVNPLSASVTNTLAYGALPTPTWPGYGFGGWYTEPGGTGKLVSSDTIVTAVLDHTLTATWTANAYTVAFDPAVGTVDPTNKAVTFDAPYGELPAPARTGYTFTGWTVSTNGVFFNANSNTVVSIPEDHTLTASWSANGYTVTFNANGGEVEPANKAVTFGSVYGELPVPERTGYTFQGWRAATNGVVFGVESNSVAAIPDGHTLTAAWTANGYTVTFDAQGGEVDLVSKAVTFDEPYGTLPVPYLHPAVRVNYIFGGWFTGTDGSGRVVNETAKVSTASDHTLFAKWTAEPYVCTPDDDAAVATAGSYDGYLYAAEAFGGGEEASAVRGTLSVKVSNKAVKLTAKAVLQKGSLSFSAKAWTGTEADGTLRATLAGQGGETLALRVRQNRIWGTLTGGSLGGEAFTLDGARNRFADKADIFAQALLDGFKGYYTVALPVNRAQSLGSANAAPEGSGYLTVTVGNGGSAKIAGVLADGSKVTQSSRLILFDGCGPEVCVPFFTPLYSKEGWSGGLLWITPDRGTVVTDRDLGWFIRWEKPGKGPDGFSMLLDACGGWYGTGAALAAGYLFTSDVDSVPYHYAGGAADWAAAPEGVAVSSAGGRMIMVKGLKPVKVRVYDETWYEYYEANPASATLSFTSRTGLFKGKFSLYYDYDMNGKLTHKAVSVPYAGVLTPVRDAGFAGLPAGMGHCLVPDNDPAVIAYRLKRSYRVWLDAAP